MKKIKKMFILIILCMTLMCGCASTKVETDINNTSMFVIIEETKSWRIVYHRETKVMYSVSYASYNSGNFTLLVNADGTPMLYKGGAE